MFEEEKELRIKKKEEYEKHISFINDKLNEKEESEHNSEKAIEGLNRKIANFEEKLKCWETLYEEERQKNSSLTKEKKYFHKQFQRNLEKVLKNEERINEDNIQEFESQIELLTNQERNRNNSHLNVKNINKFDR